MEELKLVQSFLGNTTVYPSGMHNQNKSSFLTRNLKKVLAIGTLAAATLTPGLAHAQTQETPESPSMTHLLKENTATRTFQELNQAEQKAIHVGIDLAIRTLKLVDPTLTQNQLDKMHENAFKISFTEEQITSAMQQYESFQKLSGAELQKEMDKGVAIAAAAMKKHMPR